MRTKQNRITTAVIVAIVVTVVVVVAVSAAVLIKLKEGGEVTPTSTTSPTTTTTTATTTTTSPTTTTTTTTVSPPPAGATLEDNMKAALADNKDVAKEKVNIQFYSPTENEGIIAVGAVIENRSSNLFFYDSNSQKITRIFVDSEAENNEIAAVWSICAQKVSEWTGFKLVPWGFSKVENTNVYIFSYCDGYVSEWSKWSMGTATINMDNQEIEWGFFF